MGIAKELEVHIKELAKRGLELYELRRKIIAYVKDECKKEDASIKSKYKLNDLQQKEGVAYEPDIFSEALFIGYHKLMDDHENEVDNLFKVAKNDPAGTLYEIASGMKNAIKFARDALAIGEPKGH